MTNSFPKNDEPPGPCSTVYVVAEDPGIFVAIATLVNSTGLTPQHFRKVSEFLDHIRPFRPGCLIVDAGPNGNRAADLLRQLRNSEIYLPVIFMAGQVELAVATHAVRNGALDFLQKPFDPALLYERIQEAIACDRDFRQHRRKLAFAESQLAQLSPREHEVVNLLVQGLNTKAIAAKLGISPKTVDTHRAHIFEKLEVTSIAALVNLVLKHGADKINRP